jgi:lipoyl(octanoyl) transferase
LRWRLLNDSCAAVTGADNMARDHALFEQVQNGGPPTLRFYRWDPPCLSLGRNQPARLLDDELAQHGLDLVRRPTGGAAVLHDRELTYSVCIRIGQLGSPRETYLAINRALQAGLTRLGVAAEPATTNSAAETFRRAGSCFAGAAPGEVAVRGRKLVGSAQRCERRTILQHGSVLLDGDQALVDRLLGKLEFGEPPATLLDVLGAVPEWDALVGALASGFKAELGIGLAPAQWNTDELARAAALAAHYRNAEWTWRV